MEELAVGGVTTVVVGRDVLSRVGAGEGRPMAVVAQPGSEHVAQQIVKLLGHAPLRVLPDGEAAKALSVVEEIADWLAEAGITRDGLLIAVGGGALTDVAGFIASVYLRGIAAVLVPTTLLGAVDAAIGGKTGVNVAGKNVIGTFSHPARVVIDAEILDQLPSALRRDGMAEALKAGLINDPDLVALLERDRLDADLVEVVRRAIAVKAQFVDEDFREAGRRILLNLGHTVGHGVEAAAGWSHGRAVAVGLVAAGAISEVTTGFAENPRLVAAVEALGLPSRADGVDRADVLRFVDRDKKRDAEGLRMVLLEAVGRPVVSRVDTATLAVGLDAIGVT